jgi:N-terminal TM domain of oligopeptide transport permease C
VKVTIGLALLAVFTFLAFFGSALAPYDPSARSSTGSAPPTSARTSSARSWSAPAA